MKNSHPKIGIRPIIDGRRGGIRESLEEMTMGMAQSVAKLYAAKLRYADGAPVECVIADTTIGGVAEAAAATDKFRDNNVGTVLSVTPCWCYGSETIDMDPLMPKAIWGFNKTQRPGAVYLASALAGHNQKGLPAFGIYGSEVQEQDDNSITPDVEEKLLRFGRAAVAVMQMKGKSYDHRNRNIQITHNILEHNFASASAISWKLNDVRIMTTDGTLSGYQIFDISGKQIQWHYKAVGLTPEKSQFRAYDLNTVPEKYGGNPASNEILVNVFNWDPQWKISVTEDGQELPVEQLWEKDPLYMYIRDKTQRFNNRPKDWRAVNCIHMFHTKATEANSEIVISVTDRFGNVYTEKMDRPKPFTENMN